MQFGIDAATLRREGLDVFDEHDEFYVERKKRPISSTLYGKKRGRNEYSIYALKEDRADLVLELFERGNKFNLLGQFRDFTFSSSTDDQHSAPLIVELKRHRQVRSSDAETKCYLKFGGTGNTEPVSVEFTIVFRDWYHHIFCSRPFRVDVAFNLSNDNANAATPPQPPLPDDSIVLRLICPGSTTAEQQPQAGAQPSGRTAVFISSNESLSQVEDDFDERLGALLLLSLRVDVTNERPAVGAVPHVVLQRLFTEKDIITISPFERSPPPRQDLRRVHALQKL
jgi:hypothetical protein